MSSKHADENTQTMCQSCPPYSNQHLEDEIDLLDILRLLLKNKLLIISLTLFGLILSSIYTYTRPVVYRSEGLVEALLEISSTPPVVYRFETSSDLLDNKVVFPVYTSKEKSNIFKESINLLQQRPEVHVRSTYKKKTKTLSLQSDSPESINKLISLATDETVKYFQNDFNMFKKRSLNDFEQDLTLWRNRAKVKKNDRLLELQESLSIAKESGIINPVLTQASAPLYFYGTKILAAEIQVLKKRKDDDFSMKEIRDIQGEMARLELSHFDPNSFKVMKIVQPASPPRKNTQKHALLITLGGILGLFTSFLVIAFLSIKAKLQTHD